MSDKTHTPGLHYAKTKSHDNRDVATIKNDSGTVVSRILLDDNGATCSCDWPTEEGKCIHLLLMQKNEGRNLIAEWPSGRKGKMWNWKPEADVED